MVGGAAGVAGSIQGAGMTFGRQLADSCFKAGPSWAFRPRLLHCTPCCCFYHSQRPVEGPLSTSHPGLWSLLNGPFGLCSLQTLHMVRLYPAWRVMHLDPLWAVSSTWPISQWLHAPLLASVIQMASPYTAWECKVFTPAPLCLTGMGCRWLDG